MGWGDERVSFIGHGIGLEIDELPLLARQSLHLGQPFLEELDGGAQRRRLLRL